MFPYQMARSSIGALSYFDLLVVGRSLIDAAPIRLESIFSVQRTQADLFEPRLPSFPPQILLMDSGSFVIDTHGSSSH